MLMYKMNGSRSLIDDKKASSCFFRTSTNKPYRKALLQITDECNLNCIHCFLPDGEKKFLSVETIEKKIIPRLLNCHVTRVTLTGGEPFLHQEIVEISRILRDADISVGICTNGTVVKTKQIEKLAEMGGIHVNVSLDGFKPESHGKFRGNVKSFEKTIFTIRQLAKYKLLKGFLVTPNKLAHISEYAEICNFAIQNGATYVLMNPLSSFGRGVKSINTFATSKKTLNKIRKITLPFSQKIKIAFIRFPNDKLPLGSCEAGTIFYVFVNGDTVICPYLAFAATTPKSKYRLEEFIVGNILTDVDIDVKLDNFNIDAKHPLAKTVDCCSCSLVKICGKGCRAAIVASGSLIQDVDKEMCPMFSTEMSEYE